MISAIELKNKITKILRKKIERKNRILHPYNTFKTENEKK
jgi:hypothetical protein